MDKSRKHNVTKVYCSKCDLVFESREKFEKHFDSHSSVASCEACPIDTAIAKFVSLFKRNSHKNLE
ncbi:MAG: hypothetical protein R3237_04785 [Nitrosopumilaceae archaeon]|nr:hypothetical protein [Nitrosopumilaceae archaeon]